MARTLPRMHQIRQRGQGLLDIGVLIRPVDLIQVDVVRLQPAQAVLHLPDKPPPRVALHVDVPAHRPVRLGGQHHIIPAAAQRLPDDLLRLPRRIHIRRIDEIDPAVQGGVNDPDAILMIGITPDAEHHRAQAIGAHPHPGPAQRPHPHPWPPFLSRRSVSSQESVLIAGAGDRGDRVHRVRAWSYSVLAVPFRTGSGAWPRPGSCRSR